MLSVRKMDTGFYSIKFKKIKIAWECEAFFASHCLNFLFKMTKDSFKKSIKFKSRFLIDIQLQYDFKLSINS